MKKIFFALFISSVLMMASAFSVSGQSNGSQSKVVLVYIQSVSQSATLKTLSAGKQDGFDKTAKAYVVRPSDNSPKGIAQLVAEIKSKVPGVNVQVVDDKSAAGK